MGLSTVWIQCSGAEVKDESPVNAFSYFWALEMDDLVYKIALTLIPGVGSVTGKNLVAYCGSVKQVFVEKKKALLRIPGIGSQTVDAIIHQKVFARAEQEIAFIEKHQLNALFYLDADYPQRLKNCADAPLMLYTKGKTNVNAERVLAMVGTRMATEYGREVCNQLVEGLVPYGCTIISGLAYGIDTWSHKAALDHHLPTSAVLGHSLDRVYPYANRQLASRIMEQGCLISEYVSETKPDRENFPMRNRIIAGLCDGVVVVEAGASGGALITAELANSYNRDVFAIPGRWGDAQSEGCNRLVRSNKANLIQSAADIAYLLNWDLDRPAHKTVQRSLFIDFAPDEQKVVDFLRDQGDSALDGILSNTGLLPSKAAAALLNLEFQGVVRCLPGNVFKLL